MACKSLEENGQQAVVEGLWHSATLVLFEKVCEERRSKVFKHKALPHVFRTECASFETYSGERAKSGGHFGFSWNGQLRNCCVGMERKRMDG